MKKIIEIDENFRPVDLLNDMKKGEEVMIPYEPNRFSSIRQAASRKNRDYRLMNRKSVIDKPYRVSKVANGGYITVKKVI